MPKTIAAIHEAIRGLEWSQAEHPLLPRLTPAEVDALLKAGRAEEVLSLHKRREQKLMDADLDQGDPLRHGFHEEYLEHWRDARQLVESRLITGIFGGNRSGKSEFAAYITMQGAVRCPNALILVGSQKLETSKSNQQKYIYRYIPREWKEMGPVKRDRWNFQWTPGRGFTDDRCWLPNGTVIRFFSYKSDPGDYEGYELGSPDMAQIIGFWCDEDVNLQWLTMLRTRLVTRRAKGLWTFTAVNELTPAMKEVLGTPRTIEHRPAELMDPKWIMCPDCPPGTAPYIQQPQNKEFGAIYFHSIMNPFQDYDYMVRMEAGGSVEHIERKFYGYARQAGALAFRNFGSWNVLPPDRMPKAGTRYRVIDPAGFGRKWVILWAIVTEHPKPMSVYFYREWPDRATFGEWAVTSRRDGIWDGDRGPAQKGLGWGLNRYREEMARLQGNLDPVTGVWRGEWDPEQGRWTPSAGEDIFLCYIDPRAGVDQKVVREGATSIIADAAQPVLRQEDGAMIVPPENWIPSRKQSEYEESNSIVEMLDFDRTRKVDAVTNTPHLFVSDECQNLIWCLANHTGIDGLKGASKDFIDCVHYLLRQHICHVPAARRQCINNWEVAEAI